MLFPAESGVSASVEQSVEILKISFLKKNRDAIEEIENPLATLFSWSSTCF